MEIATKGQLLPLPWGRQLAQPNLLMGGGDATSSLMFIQAANRLCRSHIPTREINYNSSSGSSELACLKPSSVEIPNNGLAEIRKGIGDYKSMGSKPLGPR